MAAGSTYTPIATQTLSSTTSVTFSSIPSTYTDLVVIVQGVAAASTDVGIRFNGDSGGNYSYTFLYGNGTSPTSGRRASQSYITCNWSASATSTLGASMHRINVMNYANTTTYKTELTRADTASLSTEAIVGLWSNTAAITTIEVFGVQSTFTSGTIVSLYGIKAA